jgi:hypothetical protein
MNAATDLRALLPSGHPALADGTWDEMVASYGLEDPDLAS